MLLVFSAYGEFCSIAQRMQEEGTPVYLYIHEPDYRQRFDGILHNKVKLGGLEAALKKCDDVLFDITVQNRKRPVDTNLLEKFGLSKNEKDLFGPIADKLKKPVYSKRVSGASRLASKIEWDREYGIKLAEKCGLDILPYVTFKTVDETVKFLDSSDGKKNLWVMKPWGDKEIEWTYVESFPGELTDILKTNILRRFGNNFPLMLQEAVEGGVEYATEQWQDSGNDPVFYTRTLESKKLADGNMSRSTGSQLNCYWVTNNLDKRMKDAFDKLNRIMDDDYVGMHDLNCIYKEDKRWFLEHTRRYGWSSTKTACALVPKGQLSTFIMCGYRALFRPGQVANSETVSLWPYPSQNDKEIEENVKGNMINHKLSELPDAWLNDVYVDDYGQLRACGSSGEIGEVIGVGDSIDSSIDRLYRRLGKLQITGNIQYRTKHDHTEQIDKRIKLLKKWEVELF